MTGIVDYGVGNLFSLYSSLKYIGEETMIVSETGQMASCDRIILPGVGAFGDAAKKLSESGMKEMLLDEVQKGKPLLGICLGMQMLFEKSYEFGEYEGLGLIPGSVRPIRDVIDPTCKVPHIGWNTLSFPEGREKSQLFCDLDAGAYVYFVHSYAAMDCDGYVSAYTDYTAPLTAAAERGRVFGTQFPP